MSQYSFLFCTFLLLANCLTAQVTPIESLKVSSNINFAYNASIYYPGLRGGIEYPIKRLDLTKYHKNRSVKRYTKFRYLSAELAFYHHPTFHDNIYLLAGWRTRRQRPNKFFTEFSSGLGYSRTFLGGETYVVDIKGNISIRKLTGYNYAMAAVGGGLGYTFHTKVSAYMRSSILCMFPSNNHVYLRPTIELGLIWKPVDFLMANIQNKSKLKGKKS